VIFSEKPGTPHHERGPTLLTEHILPIYWVGSAGNWKGREQNTQSTIII
jgi:hypothetical protein